MCCDSLTFFFVICTNLKLKFEALKLKPKLDSDEKLYTSIYMWVEGSVNFYIK